MIRQHCEDKRVLSAISSLEHNEDFKLIRAWLKSELSAMREECDTEQGIHLSWNQGACQAISAVIRVIETARETIRAMEAKGPPVIVHHSWV